MCIATPMKIEKIEKGIATVKHGGKDFKVSLRLVSKARVGDWILAHGEIAINTIPESEARAILKLIQKTETCTCDGG